VLKRFQPRNCGHDFVGDQLINFFEPCFRASPGLRAKPFEVHRLAVFDGHWHWTWDANAPSPSLISAKDSHWNHRCVRLDHSQADAGARGLEFAIDGACAFREEN